MRKKQRLIQIKPDETSVHPVGQEQFISVRDYVGDLPSGEPTDWLPQYDEYEKHPEYELAQYTTSEANELLEDEWLIDEW